MAQKEQITLNRSGAADAYPSRIYPEPKLIAREDPVVYNHSIHQSVIDERQLSFYEENGYLFLESFFDEKQVQFWKQELARLWRQSQAPSEAGGDSRAGRR
ncbi:hypothetical protein ACHHV8_15735 [Paenibacillus sp. TAB 01]